MGACVGLGMVVVFLGLFVFEFLWYGYALSLLWAWFIAPIFGLPALTITQALGVAIVVGLLTHQAMPNDSNAHTTAIDKLIPAVITLIFRPLMAIICGWIVHSFM